MGIFEPCYFEFAGQYSGEYNLIMAYVGRDEDLISGADYEPITDALPSKAEDILYGIKYSENPLEFTIDIVNLDRNIPMKQMCEIKEWLFGQDGWKKLRLGDSNYKDYYLNCLIIPETDIVDGSGYRGIRCKVRNISGFWYGEDKVITYTKEQINELKNNGQNLDLVVETQCNEKVYPIIKFMATSEDFGYQSNFILNIHNNKTDYESDMFLGIGLDKANKEIYIDCQWGKYNYQGTEEQLSALNTDYDLFYLEKGNNNISLGSGVPSSISFIYTPKVRVGGF